MIVIDRTFEKKVLFSIDLECPFPHQRLMLLDWFVPLRSPSGCPGLAIIALMAFGELIAVMAAMPAMAAMAAVTVALMALTALNLSLTV